LGLLKALGEVYAKKENATLLWKKAGSGEALKLLKEKRKGGLQGGTLQRLRLFQAIRMMG
jgi:hypothetical protein